MAISDGSTEMSTKDTHIEAATIKTAKPTKIKTGTTFVT